VTGGFSLRLPSLNHNANILVELAGYLEAGRPDGELATEAKAPRSHREIGDEVVRFTQFALDQYQDAVALLVSLATKLHRTGEEHLAVDVQNQEMMNRLLMDTTLIPPEQR
jgi:hypothetical protein